MTLPTLFVADQTTLGSQWFEPILDNPDLLGKEICELVVMQDLLLNLQPPSLQTSCTFNPAGQPLVQAEVDQNRLGGADQELEKKVREIVTNWLTRTIPVNHT